MAETYLKGEAKGIEKGIEKGAQQEREKNEARDKKIAEYLRSIGVSAEGVEAAFAIK